VNVNLGIWDKLAKLTIFLLFLLGVVGVGLWYFPLIKQNERMRQQLLQNETRPSLEKLSCGSRLPRHDDSLFNFTGLSHFAWHS
jgi:hypothetical protein